MAYKTEDMIKQCLKAIKSDNSLVFIEDIIIHVPFTKPTFYKHGLNEVNELKDALEQNKLRTKQKLRNKWANSDNPTLMIALYKLIGEKEEYIRLANARQEHDHTTKGDRITHMNDMTFDELYELKYGKKPDRTTG